MVDFWGLVWEAVPTFLTHSSTAAWVQAIGSIATVVTAVVLWRLDRRRVAQDVERQTKEHLRRVIAGLRAEIESALTAAEVQEQTIKGGLAKLAVVLQRGQQVISHGQIPPEAMAVTDGIVYRAVAPEIGRLPPEIIESVTQFYGIARAVERMAAIGGSPLGKFEGALQMLPRLRMLGAWAIKSLDKFCDAGFAEGADIRLTDDEICALAKEVGYPLDQVLEELKQNCG